MEWGYFQLLNQDLMSFLNICDYFASLMISCQYIQGRDYFVYFSLRFLLAFSLKKILELGLLPLIKSQWLAFICFQCKKHFKMT